MDGIAMLVARSRAAPGSEAFGQHPHHRIVVFTLHVRVRPGAAEKCDEFVLVPFGARDLGVSNDYRTEKMPAVNAGLLDGELAWRQHDAGHTDAPNVKYFIQWADRLMKRSTAR